MLSVREALDAILAEARPLGCERVGLLEGLGRVLAEEVKSLRDVPGYANSAMDGYAVRHSDLQPMPARLRVVGVSAAGTEEIPSVGRAEAAKIMTGAPVPPGADTVIRVEDTRADGGDVWIETAGSLGANIRLAGEDVRSGDVVLRPGRVLSPADLGLLASVGRTVLAVHRRPRVAILSTGNELVEADQPVRAGQVVNSNAYTLAAAVAEAGGVPTALPIARDTREEIRAAFTDASRFDAILSTGGVSVGEFDYVKAVMEEIGVRQIFWKVAQKPGKPLTFGVLAGRPFFGLPGNPVSSLVCFYLYARPALRRMAGHAAVHLPTTSVKLGTDLKKAEGLTEFVRCRLEASEGSPLAVPTGTQSSAVLSSMSRGQALLVAPAGSSRFEAGSTMRAILLEGASDDAPF